MKSHNFILVAGLVFTLAGALHLFRILSGWDLVLGEWLVPVWLSALVVLITGFLAIQAFRLARK